MLVERTVDLFQVRPQAAFQRPAGTVEGLPATDLGEHAEPQRRAEALADHADLLDAIVHRQAILDRRRRHVLALAGLEDFLHPPGQAQVAVGVLLALVAGAQETVGGEHLGGLLRLLVVADHGCAATHLHLALVADAYLDAGAVLADPAGLLPAGPADVGVAAVLGHPVDLEHIQAQAAIPEQQRLGYRRRAAERVAHRVQA
ncbi:Uncharacterised protein [Acinetobacter baumannii]|nr:Uncharacterised protein [Acinetobacter baumannii]